MYVLCIVYVCIYCIYILCVHVVVCITIQYNKFISAKGIFSLWKNCNTDKKLNLYVYTYIHTYTYTYLSQKRQLIKRNLYAYTYIHTYNTHIYLKNVKDKHKQRNPL